MNTNTTSNFIHKKRRLVLTLYRSLMRWCQRIPSTVPLDDFLPPLRDRTIDNVHVFRQVLRETFRDDDDSPQQEDLTKRIQQGLDGLKQLNALTPGIMAFHQQWGSGVAGMATANAKQKQKQKRPRELLLQPHSQPVLNLLGSDKEEPSSSAYNDSLSSDFDESKWLQERLDAVAWLPPIDECKPRSIHSMDEESKFPLFPLQGPLFHADVIAGSSSSSYGTIALSAVSMDPLPLPLFTPQMDIPVPGMGVPLQIFEPRYRQLYSDLSSISNNNNNNNNNNNKRKKWVVMPFGHPLVPGKFARHALVHEVTELREVADETNGKIQYLVHHVVQPTPIFMEQILNPQVWATKETYLQVQGTLLGKDADEQVTTDDTYHDVYEPLHDVLENWKRETSHPLATKSLLALNQGDGLWALVHLWNLHFRQELLQLQLGVATQVKRLAQLDDIMTAAAVQRVLTGDSSNNNNKMATAEIVVQAQQPHRRRLLQLMMDTSLLVPTLLAMDGQEKCQYLMDMVQQERRFLSTNSF